jgi:hypothetical protein
MGIVLVVELVSSSVVKVFENEDDDEDDFRRSH